MFSAWDGTGVRLDRMGIGVRERTHAEILDLALLVARRHGLGLGLCLAAGVLPCAAFNTFLASTADRDDLPWFAFMFYPLFVAFEAPWATAFLTLFLGQVTFQQQVAPRKLVRDFLSSLPQMFLLQGLVRGLCLVSFFLIFPPLYVLIGLRYANEVILLERGRMRASFRRLGQFHKGIRSRIEVQRLANFLVAILLWGMLIGGLGWLEGYLFFPDDSSLTIWSGEVEPALWLASAMVGWRGQASLWLVLAYLTVVRYLSYLDLRIRREGWEVELQLMAEGSRWMTKAW